MDELYVKNESKLIYKVTIGENYYIRKNLDVNSNTYFTLDLSLIAGIDYINPDENDLQGYVNADRFINDVQYESITIYPMNETIKDRLKEEGYTIISKLPTIY